MARPLSIALAGGLYHVTSRGDRRAEAAPAWLQTARVLGRFSPQRGWAIKRCIDFVREGVGVGLPGVWAQLRGQVFPGGDAFLKRRLQRSDQSNPCEIPRA